MARTAGWWVKQAYMALIPSYPVGYLLVNGFRGDQFWTKFYIDRSVFAPSENLKDLVESELDRIGDIKKAQVLVSLTDCGEPRTYGGFFLKSGAELQFPVRVSFDDVENARRLARNIEVDLGLARHRRKIEVDSKVGEELLSRMMLSELAKKFIIQRELHVANSGVLFCAPMFAWFGIFGAGYAFVVGLSKVIGVAAGSIVAAVVGICAFRQFYKTYSLYKIKWADEKAVEMDSEYLQGARDYFNSTMKLNRLLRVLLGDEGKKNIAKNGDCRLDRISLSARLKHLETYSKPLK